MTDQTNPTDPTGVTARDARGLPGGLPGGLRQAAQEYLATRRALGFTLSTQGRLLRTSSPTAIDTASPR